MNIASVNPSMNKTIRTESAGTIAYNAGSSLFTSSSSSSSASSSSSSSGSSFSCVA